MPSNKRTVPESAVTLSVTEFMGLWITQLQTEITHQETDADKAKFMVRGYDSQPLPGTESDWTEIDIYTDDFTNLVDGTWTEPQIWREDAQSPAVPDIQSTVEDSTAIVKLHGGYVTEFEVSEDPYPHYEVTLDGQKFGPMVETELYWFAYGLKWGSR